MACLDDNVLSAHLERRLGAGETAKVVEHLDGCVACADVLVALARAHCPTPALTVTAPTDASVASVAGDEGAPVGPPETRAVSAYALPRFGRYVTLAPLGAGGMGLVHAAYDPKLDRRVAIKLLRGVAASRSAQRMLVREARTMARVSHPNVLAVHDVGSHDGHMFIVMDYVDGGTLRAWLRDEKPDRAAIVSAMVNAGRGLAAAHKAGLVHRDFKPDNVLRARDGRVFVADFGLTRAAPVAAEAPHASHGSGTPAYMAPEVMRGHSADARSDQFSFCLTLAEALVGHRGDKRATPDATPLSLDGLEPPALARALARGLAQDPAQRFPSMDELLAELAPFADGAARATPPAPRAARRGLALAGAFAALAFLGGLAAWARAPKSATSAPSVARAEGSPRAADATRARDAVDPPPAAAGPASAAVPSPPRVSPPEPRRARPSAPRNAARPSAPPAPRDPLARQY